MGSLFHGQNVDHLIERRKAVERQIENLIRFRDRIDRRIEHLNSRTAASLTGDQP